VWLRELERRTRPADPEVLAAVEQPWDELPAGVQTPGQMLGRKFTGCEGTHGVFPACNFGCEPCYLSANANRVRVDGTHTVAEVERQMAFLRERRGPAQYAQLIGGEVSLLPAQAHAEALAVMRRYGRVPRSFSHGDFDYEYLEKIAVAPDGTRRFDLLSFAIHIDSTMRGRRGTRQASSERALHAERRRVKDMFDRLTAEHGVRTHLAHNMTVTLTTSRRWQTSCGCVASSATACARSSRRRWWATNVAGVPGIARSRMTPCGPRGSAVPGAGCRTRRCRSATSAATRVTYGLWEGDR
jgi:hypothetical protein